jgi:hypothetical protein
MVALLATHTGFRSRRRQGRATDDPEGGMTLGIVKRTEEEFQQWLG